MSKPKHPSRRYRIRVGHSLYQVGTVGLYPDVKAVVSRVEVLGPRLKMQTDSSGEIVTGAPVKWLEKELVAGGEWLRYYVFFSRRKAKSFASRLQLKIDAYYHKAG